MSITKHTIVATLALAAVNAEIVQNSFWEGQDLTNAALKVGVEDGHAYGTDDATDQFIRSAWSRPGLTDHYDSQPNTIRVQAALSEAQFDAWFQSQASYQDFLIAAAKWPAFCNEQNEAAGYDDLMATCKREIAALLSTVYESSNGFTQLEDPACADGANAANCGNYFARGPLGLSGEEEYGHFSKLFYDGYDASNILLDDPQHVADIGYVAWSSAMYKHMVQKLPSASPHSVMTGFYVPNGSDRAAGYNGGFGTVMSILAPEVCGTWSESAGSRDRVSRFNRYLGDLGLAAENQNTSCARSWANPAWNGAANVQLYFENDWQSNERCQVVSWKTDYPAIERESYKKCVCDNKLGGEENENCVQHVDEDPEPTPEPGPNPNNILEELLNMIRAIKDKPHYSDEEKSRTTWQTDETLDWVEMKLWQIETAFRENDIM